MISRFHSVYDKLNQALDDVPFEALGISVEVKEQVNFLFLLDLECNLHQCYLNT